ncbi:acylphosphatase [Herbiconiux ginsengi]|uniref:acylphosphatase n=1 Tax=Herbiconiux ginsengi TaxID=381665 RepID=A0A1H3QE55_9MICO|nr:acylphosphatase [Herbiconiux ginsengi]SDZ11295.1 acylphosphatase [Herbiconiux ginsengi]
MVRRRVVVRGQVQGVGYRWAARDQAVALGVTGFVQNLRDGSVLAEVEGSAAAVDAMVQWMRSGPPGATVTSIEIDADAALDTPISAGFEIRH